MTNPQPRLIGRDRLANQLREIRAHGGRSVRDFSKVTNIPASKISRVENGHQVPNAAELDAWVLGAVVDEANREALRTALHELRDDALTERSLNRRRFKDGQEGVQAEFNDLSASATKIRTFQDTLIPSLLQTPEYARAMLELVPNVVAGATDVEAGVARRMERRGLLSDTSRQFEFILWEPALRRRYGTAATMRGQLFHLGAAIGLPNIRFGIIPLDAQATVPNLAPFILYDDFAVTEHLVDDPRYTGKDAQLLHDYMDLLWAEAVEGDEARRIILAAGDSLLH